MPGEEKDSAVEMSGYTFSKARRICRNADFKRVYALGKKIRASSLTLYWLKTSDEQPARIGVAVGRKVANAVIRNRIKRRIREIYRTYPQPLSPGYWILVNAKRECAEMDINLLRESFYAAILEIVSV